MSKSTFPKVPQDQEHSKSHEVDAVPFELEWIKVKDLEVDPEVQRAALDRGKVDKIKRQFNPGALDTIAVSRRNRVTQVIIDGWHRWTAVRELTDNEGEMLCRVFEKLSPQEESWLFLDLNYGNQPNILDKFRQRLRAGDAVATEVDKLTKAYGFVIQPGGGQGTLQCVGALERIYNRSIKGDFDPNLLQLTLLVVSRAWGNDRVATQAMVLDGMSHFLAEYTSLLDIDRVIQKLKNYPGGSDGFLNDAQEWANTRHMRVPLAVADQFTLHYNKSAGKNVKLPEWRKHS